MSVRSTRLNQFLFVGLLGLLGAGGVIMGLVGYQDFSTGLARHDTVVTSFPYSSAILVISLFFLVTAVISGLPTPVATRSGKAQAQTPKWVERLRMAWLVCGAVCIIGGFFVRPVRYKVIDQIARKHGYIACPAITLRHDDDRWALRSPESPTGLCPKQSGHPIRSAR